MSELPEYLMRFLEAVYPHELDMMKKQIYSGKTTLKGILIDATYRINNLELRLLKDQPNT